jgi:hypothetical protein
LTDYVTRLMPGPGAAPSAGSILISERSGSPLTKMRHAGLIPLTQAEFGTLIR